MNKKTGIIAVTILVAVALLFVLLVGTSCNAGSDEEATTPAAGSEATTPSGETEDGETAPVGSGASAAEETLTAQTKVNLNVRQGPGTNYPVVGSISADSEVTVIGRNKDGSWLVVKTEKGQGWISGQADFVEVDQAAVDGLPFVEAPPPAYDASNPKVQAILNQIPLVVYHERTFTCASHGGLNNLLPEVAEGNVIGPHSGDFVYGSDNVLFQYTNGTFQLIKESPVARFENGEKSLPLDKALELFASGDIVWTGTLGDWPGRGVPGCDPAAKPQ